MLTDADPREVQELARGIDELMSSIASRSGISDTSRLALLVCLHLADQLNTAKRDNSDLKAELDDRVKRVASMLDQLAET